MARPSRQTESRWDPPPAPESDAPIEASRFAPASSVSFRPGGHGGPGEPDSSADELLFATDDDTYFDEPPVDDQYDVVPGYGDDDLLPYPEDELAAMQPRRSRRVPLAIAGLLAVLVIGGAAVIMLRSGGTNEPPPIIAADSAPTKITPENAGTSEGDGQSKLIYDRVDPNSEVADSKLVVTDDNPIADIPPVPEDTTSNEVSRVILGGGPGVDSASNETGAPGTGNSQPAGNGGMTVASSAQEPASIGPRKVRTVVVRPDGTIVSNEAVPQEQGDAQDVPQNETQSALTELPPASETPPAPAADENPLLSDNFGVEAIDNPTGETSAGSSASASIPDFPPPTSNQAAPSRPSAQAPKVVASTGSANATSSQSSAGLGGGFLVQVSSQRSEATALETFAELQRRYPSILGDRAPDIQRADLGDRGIYYRVRVGYPTREQAVTMCENLKAAGGDCLLATR